MRQRLDPAWLDAQYNNRARVPDYTQHLQRWGEASAPGAHRAGCAARPGLWRR
jgi:arylformamidase